MKNIYRIQENTIFLPTVTKNINITLVSDIHFSSLVGKKDLQKITYQIKRSNPDYICIVGDTIDHTNILDREQKRNELLVFLEQIGDLAPVCFSLGGHDFRRSNTGKGNATKGHYEWLEEFWQHVEEINNVSFLHNAAYSNQDILFGGFTQSHEYYHSNNNQEDKNILLKEMKNNPSLFQLPSDDKLKIALIHSPIHLKDPEIIKQIRDYDAIFSGHMHHGCVVPILDELWSSNTGLIAPNKSLFPDYSRGKYTLVTEEGKRIPVIVSGGITTIQECAPWFLRPGDHLFPRRMNHITFTPDPEKENSSHHYTLVKKR